MSLHKSLKSANALVRRRNVLTRAERIELLKERGKWKAEDGVYGLPKTKVATMAAPKKKRGKQEVEEGGEE